MSHGKESTRQKMIGMMYLVLTCLLAMNVSKDILKGFITVNESLERTNKNFSENTVKMLEGFKSAIKNGHPEAKPYYDKAVEATTSTNELFAYIGILKAQIQQYTEDVKGADTMQLRYVEKKDNFDDPTYFLIGDNEANPKSGQYTARELRQKMTTLSDKLLAMIETMRKVPGTKIPDSDFETLKKKITSIRPVDPNEKEDDVPVTWELQNFYHLPLAAVITNLSKIQSDLKNVEGELVSVFSAAPGKLTVPMNVLQPRVVAHSNYIQAGQPYQAEVFLAASSTEFKDDNLQVVLGEYDTVTGQAKAGAEILKIENGMGKIDLAANAAGHKDYKGMIRLKDGTGKFKYFPFKEEYIVANPSVAVSPEKMNVFYIGVPNPVAISAAGISPGDLRITLKGCGGKLIDKGNGKYEISVSSAGKCTVTVAAQTPEGLKQQGLPLEFRVKEIPDPQPKIGGKTGNGTLDISTLEVQGINTMTADLGNFDFNAKFNIISFTIGMSKNGVYKDFECTNKVSDEAKQELAKCKKGTKIFVENIKAIGPDEKVRKLANMILKVK
ncbi:MAG: gliding motility protein GldM [Bacteroidia bacterium]